MDESREILLSDKSLHERLAKQVQAEYLLSWKNQKAKKDEWFVRLKLYNNQKRDKDAVGDTTLFTVFQTILASLYSDRLTVEFGGREEGDEEVAENLNAMAGYDYDEMEKDEIDYEWIWNSLFFSRGLLAFYEYERDPDKGIYLPIPEVIDPIPFLHDPQASSINGNRRRKGAARFMGSEIKMSGQEIEELPHRTDTFKISDLSFGSGTYSLLADTIEARDTAQGRTTQKLQGEKNLGVNANYDITRWYTHFEFEGGIKKVIVWSANERTKVVGLQILKNDYWPIIDRPLYPTAHDFDGTSIPDLTEDKQRARAVAQNLGLRAMKADLYPMYIYDSNKILNPKDLNFAFNKFI
ncbi:hypothetical protein FJY90_03935, partial [Candidatus Gottesmanbacteria bacterium]|nr:hypothetical protein [Candidatus Gottesmanbacteria bacterium]